MAKSHESGRDPTTDLLSRRPFPELAAALRSQAETIIGTWTGAVREAVPSAANLPAAQLQDHLPAILAKVADVVESASGQDVDELMRQSPAKGLTRFRQRYDVRELMTEDRLLRRVIIEQVEVALGRRMIQAEQIVLDTSIDLMLQGAVVGFITEQHEKLRAAAEAELKYLSFLSHDLSNTLGNVTVMLQVLKQQLATSKEFERVVGTLDAAQQSILDTIGGMGRLLQSERLRKAGGRPERRPVVLARLASAVAQTLSDEARGKGVNVAVEVPADCVCQSDGELLGLIVQNLVGNAVKYSTGGTVRVRAACDERGCVVSVSDEGPGIAVEHLDRIFDAFRRGEGHGQPGVGLGLTIASQAAKLLGGTLAVESKVGEGSTFTLTLAV